MKKEETKIIGDFHRACRFEGVSGQAIICGIDVNVKRNIDFQRVGFAYAKNH